MRIQVAPGKWEDIGPIRHIGRLKATGYTIATSNFPTIESQEKELEARTNLVGKRKHDGRQYRKIKAVVK